jgi:hypothetical protein
LKARKRVHEEVFPASPERLAAAHPERDPPFFARAAWPREMQHATVVRPQEVGHSPRQVDGRLELVLEIAEPFRVRLAALPDITDSVTTVPCRAPAR